MPTNDEIRVNGFQLYQVGPQHTGKARGGLGASEMQLRYVKEVNGRELDQDRVLVGHRVPPSRWGGGPPFDRKS